MDVRYFRALFLSTLIVVTFSALAACSFASRNPDRKAEAETYIRSHITELSPEPAVLGGTFFVTDIQWEGEDTALVSYEDGHIALRGRTTIRENDGTVTTSPIVLEPEETSQSSASSSVIGRVPGEEGAFCGGIAAFPCEAGLTCKLDGTYPDAGGVCVKE